MKKFLYYVYVSEVPHGAGTICEAEKLKKSLKKKEDLQGLNIRIEKSSLILKGNRFK